MSVSKQAHSRASSTGWPGEIRGMMRRCSWVIGLVALVCAWVLPASAQRDRGELQIEVRVQQGATLTASGELVSEGNQFHLNFQIGDDGKYVAQDLAFGVYRLSLAHGGFSPASRLFEIRTIVPQRVSLTMGLKAVETQVEVEAEGA